jgi:hypothetical protein
MKNGMAKKITEDDKLEYQSNENYPWEYEQPNEVWVTNFDVLKKKKAEEESKEDQDEVVEEKELIEEESVSEDVEDAMEENAEIYLGDDEDEEALRQAQDDGGDIYTEPEVEIETEADLEDEEELREEDVMSFGVADLGESVAAAPKRFSWLLTSIILFFIIVGGEVLLIDLSVKFYWTSGFVLTVIWLWRIALLISWLIFGIKKWHLDKEQVFATTVTAFVFGVVAAAIWKIIVIESVWTWINLLIEPIWMLLVIAVIGSLLVKILFRNKA